MLELILFYTFAVIAVVTAVLVITQRNVVHSAVALAGTLLAVAGIFLTLNAEFLAGVQVIVYVGGILVLFVFVIMLIALESSLTERQFHRQGRIALVTAVILIGMIAYGLFRGKVTLPSVSPQAAAQGFNLTENTRLVGETLYRNYLLPFEIASILLLVAIVGAVALAKRKAEVE
jgi:NADH-quinone oxidoreductase subunit J